LGFGDRQAFAMEVDDQQGAGNKLYKDDEVIDLSKLSY
jgi:hypothetical protein